MPHSDKSVNIKWLWMAMQALYPAKWNAAMGEVTGVDGKLSVQARTWQRGLSGISSEQVAIAIDYLTDNYSSFIPDLGEFKTLCVKRNDVPSLDKCVQVLANVRNKNGTVAERFEHPLILAINSHPSFDAHNFRVMSSVNASKHVEPIYNALLASGFDGFKPGHYEKQEAITHEKARSSEKAIEALKGLSDVLNVKPEQSSVKPAHISVDIEDAKPTPAQIMNRETMKQFQLSRIRGMVTELSTELENV